MSLVLRVQSPRRHGRPWHSRPFRRPGEFCCVFATLARVARCLPRFPRRGGTADRMRVAAESAAPVHRGRRPFHGCPAPTGASWGSGRSAVGAVPWAGRLHPSRTALAPRVESARACQPACALTADCAGRGGSPSCPGARRRPLPTAHRPPAAPCGSSSFGHHRFTGAEDSEQKVPCAPPQGVLRWLRPVNRAATFHPGFGTPGCVHGSVPRRPSASLLSQSRRRAAPSPPGPPRALRVQGQHRHRLRWRPPQTRVPRLPLPSLSWRRASRCVGPAEADFPHRAATMRAERITSWDAGSSVPARNGHSV